MAPGRRFSGRLWSVRAPLRRVEVTLADVPILGPPRPRCPLPRPRPAPRCPLLQELKPFLLVPSTLRSRALRRLLLLSMRSFGGTWIEFWPILALRAPKRGRRLPFGAAGSD